MTREHKLALIVGFSLVLVLGVLISDHFSKARTGQPLIVEITDPVSSPFGPRTASASQQLPGSTLPPTQTPTLTQGGADRAIDPLPGLRQPQTSGQSKATEISMGGTGSPTSLTNVTTTPLPVGATPVPAGPSGNSGLPISTGVLKRYEVKKDDYIFTIAKKFYGDGNLWTSLRDYNKGRVTESGGMREGITLEIPPRDVLEGKARLGDPRLSPIPPAPGTAPQSFTPKADPTTNKPDAKLDPKADPKAAGYTTYTVQDGDTLYSIARKKLGSTKRVQDLIDANKSTLSTPDELKVGMSIRIPAR